MYIPQRLEKNHQRTMSWKAKGSFRKEGMIRGVRAMQKSGQMKIK